MSVAEMEIKSTYKHYQQSNHHQMAAAKVTKHYGRQEEYPQTTIWLTVWYINEFDEPWGLIFGE